MPYMHICMWLHLWQLQFGGSSVTPPFCSSLSNDNFRLQLLQQPNVITEITM